MTGNDAGTHQCMLTVLANGMMRDCLLPISPASCLKFEWFIIELVVLRYASLRLYRYTVACTTSLLNLLVAILPGTLDRVMSD